MPCGFILFFPFSYNAISFLSPRRCVGERVGGWPVLEHNPLQTDGRKMTSKFAHEVGYVCVCAMHSSTCAEKKKCNHRFPSEGDLKRKKKSNHAAHSDTKISPYLNKLFHLQLSQAHRQEPLPCPPQPILKNIPHTQEKPLPGMVPVSVGTAAGGALSRERRRSSRTGSFFPWQMPQSPPQEPFCALCVPDSHRGSPDGPHPRLPHQLSQTWRHVLVN